MCKDIIMIGMIAAALALGSCKNSSEDSSAVTAQEQAEEGESANQRPRSSYSGTVRESMGADLSFSVAGMVREMYVGKGDHLKKGQLIGKLDDSSLRSAYNSAAAELKKAQEAYNRAKMLNDDAQLADADFALRQAKCAVAAAKSDWNACSLYAPMDGYVAERYADPGTTAAPDNPAIRLVDIDPVRVVIPVPEGEIGKVEVGQQGVVTFAGLDKKYIGEVVQRDITANPVTHTYDVRIEVDNPNELLLPGMECQVYMPQLAGIASL